MSRAMIVETTWEQAESAACAGDRAWGDFVASQYPLVNRTASVMVRRYSLAMSHRDDVVQECWIAVDSLRCDVVPRLRRLPWSVAVSLASQDRVKALSESAAVTGVQGSSGVTRRRRALMTFRASLASSGEYPTDERLVELFNAKMRATRSNAVKQGVIASVEDLRSFDPVEYDPSLDGDTPGHESDCPLIPVEARAVIARGVQRCAELDELLGLVARAYYGDALDEPPHIGTAAEVAREVGLGLSIVWVKDAMAAVDEVMRDVLASDFGIERP